MCVLGRGEEAVRRPGSDGARGVEKRTSSLRITCLGEYRGGRGGEGCWDVEGLPHQQEHGGRSELGAGLAGYLV